MNLEYLLKESMDWIVCTSLHASFLIVLVFAVQLVFRRLLNPRWRYMLWLLVALRLAMPAVPSTSLSVFNLNRVFLERTELAFNSAHMSFRSMEGNMAGEKLSPAVAARLTPANRGHWQKTFLIVWLAGVGFLSGSVAWEHYRFSARVIRQRPSTDPDLLNLLEDCKAELKIHAPINIIMAPQINAPMLMGFIRPRLLLPEIMARTFSPKELRYVLLHELGHLKRHDISINWLTTILQILHWFNPLVWLAFHQMRTDREQACDAFVLASVNKGINAAKKTVDIAAEKTTYGETIIKLLNLFNKRISLLPGLVGIMEEKKQMKARMQMIARFTSGSYGLSGLAAVLMVLITAVGFTGAMDKAPSGVELKNLLGNSGFETVVDGRTAEWAPWAAYNEPIAPAKVTFSSDTNVVHGGKASLCIRSSDEKICYGCKQGMNDKALAITNGATVRLSGYIKSDSANAMLSIDIGGKEAGSKTSEPEGKEINKNGWTKHILAFELAPGSYIDAVHCIVQSRGTAWFDDVSLTITSKGQADK